jgi:hypothetical protein
LSAPLSLFQWRTNGANQVCAIITGALGKSMAQMRCAIAFPLMARQRRNGARPDTGNDREETDQE